MADILYPHAQLPGVATIKWSPTVNVLSTDDDATKMEVRRISGHAGSDCDLSFLFLKDQYKIFKAWWKTTLGYGQRWFWIKLPMSIGFTWQLVRFTDANYKWTMPGHRKYQVQSGIEIRDRFFTKDPTAFSVITSLAANLASLTSSGGILISGLSASETYQVTLPPDQFYTGYSAWPSDDSMISSPPPPGQYWGNAIWLVGGPGPAISLTSPNVRMTSIGVSVGYPDGVHARNAFPGGTVTGYTEYKLCIVDPNPLDNRGGVSVKLERV